MSDRTKPITEPLIDRIGNKARCGRHWFAQAEAEAILDPKNLKALSL